VWQREKGITRNMISIGVKKLASAIEPSLKHLSEAATLPCRKVVVL